MKNVLFTWMFLACILLMGEYSYASDQLLNSPDQTGPFPVGVTTIQVVDPERTDAMTHAHRMLLTEIWYPAVDNTADARRNSLKDFFPGRIQEYSLIMKIAFHVDLGTVIKTFQSKAFRDIAVRAGKWPLVLFSHGNGGMRFQDVFWCEHIASHGYIVVAPDHTGNSLITGLIGDLTPFNDSQYGRRQAALDRPKDISFLIDCMERFNRGADSRFCGKIDMDHIAVAGHSFGGYTATMVADQDARVDAIIPMAGVNKSRSRYDCPVMLLMAGEDDTIGQDGNTRIRRYYQESTGEKYLLNFINAGHYSFTEMYQFNPQFGDGCGTGKRITNGKPVTYISKDKAERLINGYTTAFLNVQLKHRRQYRHWLMINHDPREIEMVYLIPDLKKREHN